MLGIAFMGYVLPWGQMCGNTDDNCVNNGELYLDRTGEECVCMSLIYSLKHPGYGLLQKLIRKNSNDVFSPGHRCCFNTLGEVPVASNVSFGMNVFSYSKARSS